MLRSISGRDHRLMRRVHKWYPPRWFRGWMVAASRLGDGWIWYAAGLAVLLFGGQHRWRAAACAAASGVASVLAFKMLKGAIGRKRPCDIEPHCWNTLLPPDRFSFPSGHAMGAFATAVPLGLFYPAWTPLLAFVSGSIAVSRVILGMHFLSDVLAGSALGAALGYVCWMAGAG